MVRRPSVADGNLDAAPCGVGSPGSLFGFITKMAEFSPFLKYQNII